jgi:hypothetical protein
MRRRDAAYHLYFVMTFLRETCSPPQQRRQPSSLLTQRHERACTLDGERRSIVDRRQPAIPTGTPSGSGHDFGQVAVLPKISASARSSLPAAARPFSPYHKTMPISLPFNLREGEASADLQRLIDGIGPSAPLPSSVKDPIEHRAGYTLEKIRVHDNRNSELLAGLLNSEAFTVGNDIFLGGRKDRRTPLGRLLAHEIAHSLQQDATASTNGSSGRVYGVDQPEREADGFADALAGYETEALPALGRASRGLARKVIWKQIIDLPGDLLLIIDVDDGDFVGGCVRAIVPHAGIKLIQKFPHLELFNLHVGFLVNAASEFCIFFYESVTGICELKCFPSKEALREAWDEVMEWLEEMLKRVFTALAILALIVAAVVLAYLIAQAIAAALLVLLAA